MKMSFRRAGVVTAGSVLIAGGILIADGTKFSDFTPLAASAGPTLNEAMPITLGSAAFQQRSIADRQSQQLLSYPNSGNWDMITVNETGQNAGRYLFTVFETGSAGVQRTDLVGGQTQTIWQTPTAGGHVAFDACFWTPWGTLITAEESWSTAAGGSTSPYGRLFELRNPLTAPGIFNPVTPASNAGADFVHRNIIPRVSHEGVQFDAFGNMYFIDELDGGSFYKYTPKASMVDVLAGRADYFAAGQTFVLRVGDGNNGNTPNATGYFKWYPITDVNGVGLPGTITIVDTNGVRSVDGRNTTNLPAFKGSDYMRPEDLQIKRSGRGHQLLFATTTSTHETYVINLTENWIRVFANRNTINLATGAPVGSALANPDNLAVDAEGYIYIIEDRAGGVDNDIWFAKDLNRDGDLNDPGEGLARWASNGTVGSEFTGLYFDPFDSRRAWVNIQHPASGNDRTIEITVPVPVQ